MGGTAKAGHIHKMEDDPRRSSFLRILVVPGKA
jgi:hypothetical protein